MSGVNSVRVSEEVASDSGSDGVEAYVNPVNEDENNEDTGKEDAPEKKQRYNGGDAGDSKEPAASGEAREAREELEKYLALQHLRQQERDTLAIERDSKQAALEALSLERARKQDE